MKKIGGDFCQQLKHLTTMNNHDKQFLITIQMDTLVISYLIIENLCCMLCTLIYIIVN